MAIIFNLLFFPPLIAGNAILLWAFHKTTKAGIWPTEKFFGFTIRRSYPFDYFRVIKLLRQRIANTEDAMEARRYRAWLNALFLGYGLAFFALAVFLAFIPWLYTQIP